MLSSHLKTLVGQRHIHVVGLGSVARTLLPILFDAAHLASDQVTVYSPEPVTGFSTGRMGTHRVLSILPSNYRRELGERLRPDDFVLNLATEVSSADLIDLCQTKGALYLDTVIEPWGGWYDNANLTPAARSNYALREQLLQPGRRSGPTAVVTHGANPGLVSHFAKMAIQKVGERMGFQGAQWLKATWPERASRINLRAIHIAEYDSQSSSLYRRHMDFHNTWSVMGFVAEAGQPAELGWGTHESMLPTDGHHHASGCGASIWLDRPGAEVRVKSWVPGVGPFHGFLITHGESISLADYLTLRDSTGRLLYRPTVHYAYRPCDAAMVSLHDLQGRCWKLDPGCATVLGEDVVEGEDTLGVLLGYGNQGSYWYGSRMTVKEARSICRGANATTVQVAAGVLGGMVWAMENPARGLVEPEEMDAQRVLEVARPYLGECFGEFTSWHPLAESNPLFATPARPHEPWDFSNVRVGLDSGRVAVCDDARNKFQ